VTWDRGRVVLIVEDDDDLRQLYRTALTAAGFAVVSVADGVDALQYIEQQRPSAIVLDLGLPRLRGDDVYAELTAQGLADKIPVVVVTGDTRNLDAARFSCVLRKPIDIDELVAAVRKCLGGA
jgi:two-component system, OmpR family, response regulator MprA